MHCPQAAQLPELTERALIGATTSVIGARLMAGQAHQLAALEPQLVQLVLMPYIGAQEAARIARFDVVAADASDPPPQLSPSLALPRPSRSAKAARRSTQPAFRTAVRRASLTPALRIDASQERPGRRWMTLRPASGSPSALGSLKACR